MFFLHYDYHECLVIKKDMEIFRKEKIFNEKEDVCIKRMRKETG